MKQSSIPICTHTGGYRFISNTCPRNSGGVYADANLHLKDCMFSDNTAKQAFFGTANVGQMTVVNTSMKIKNAQGVSQMHPCLP